MKGNLPVKDILVKEIHEIEKLLGASLETPSEVILRKGPKVIAATIFFSILLLITCLMFIPWQQSVVAGGVIVPYLPNERMQQITATVPGVISKWFVIEGQKVKEGEQIVEIIDNDPMLIERLEAEKRASEAALMAAETALNTSKKHLERQKYLSSKGLSSQRAYELAQIEYNKLISDVSGKQQELMQVQVKIARQSSQFVRAPRDGTILRIVAQQGGLFVKAGDNIATLVPNTDNKVAELHVTARDLPLIDIGTKVRLQFEGWPAVQFSGWPSVAVGTFGGEVVLVDASDAGTGKGNFRVLVAPDKSDDPWPDNHYLRQGVRTYGWFLMGEVKLGYELWRLFNSFPVTRNDIEGSDGNGGFIYKKKDEKKEEDYYKDTEGKEDFKKKK
jgi:multidrug efflux pump subunit AcrA (membrane-fusion protein)